MPGFVLSTWKAALSTLDVGLSVGVGGILEAYAFFLAEFVEEFGIGLCKFSVVGVYDVGFLYILETEFGGFCQDFVFFADKGDSGETFGDNTVGCLESTGFSSFGEHEALGIVLSLKRQLFKEIHRCSGIIWCCFRCGFCTHKVTKYLPNDKLFVTLRSQSTGARLP